ncbi:hypothetical protein ABQE43_04330, partial [Mycolicibacter minnesotensis]
MGIFGRRSARQRLRNAARESLAIPAFTPPVDCSSWVLGGLWPVELATVTPDTAPLAQYLDADLRRIANSANEKLHAIGSCGLTGQARQDAEARVINVARAFAVLRVESTVRQLHKEPLEFGTEYISLAPAPGPAPELTRAPARTAPVYAAEVYVAEPIPAEPAPRPAGPPFDGHAHTPRHRLPDPVTVEAPQV